MCELIQFSSSRSHTIIYTLTDGQISTFGLGCAGRTETKITSTSSIPQKVLINIPFSSYKAMKQVGTKIFDRSVSFDLFTFSYKSKYLQTKRIHCHHVDQSQQKQKFSRQIFKLLGYFQVEIKSLFEFLHESADTILSYEYTLQVSV